MSVPGSPLWHAGIQSCPPAFAFQAAPAAAVAPPALPEGNQLLWTEAMDNAAWTKTTFLTVTADLAPNPSPPGDGSSTADQCAYANFSRRLSQTTTLACSGAELAMTNINPVPASWTRFNATATFTGLGDLVASVYVQFISGLGSLRLDIDVVGGFIRCSLLSVGGAVAANVWGWQLESGATPTAYSPRTT